MCSNTTSTPSFLVISLTFLFQSASLWFTTLSAPSSRHLSIFCWFPAVAMTLQLYNFAIWIPAIPTPLVPPIINTVWPGIILARPTSMCHAVIPTIEMAAASSNETFSGSFATFTSGRCVYWAKPPHSGPVWNPHMFLSLQSYSLPAVHCSHILQLILEWDTTLSPTLNFDTSSPISTTVPATSLPDIWGSGVLTGSPHIAHKSL